MANGGGGGGNGKGVKSRTATRASGPQAAHRVANLGANSRQYVVKASALCSEREVNRYGSARAQLHNH